MRTTLRNVAKVALFASLFVAARPYIEFLVLPPTNQAYRWMVTVIALGISAALYVAIKNMDEVSPGKDQGRP